MGRGGRYRAVLAAMAVAIALALAAPPQGVAAEVVCDPTLADGGPPVVVGCDYSVAEKFIRSWDPRVGWSGVPDFSPVEAALSPDVAGLAVVVRQGAPVDFPTDSKEATGDVHVPLTMGVTMPNLVDESRSDAEALLAKYGLANLTWKPAVATPDAVVMSQSPSADAQVAFDDPVVITFGDFVVVPNVVGMLVEKARRTLQEEGLRLAAGSGPGRVTSQQPPAQQLVERKSTVTVTWVDVETFVVPNIVGFTSAQARQSVEQARLRYAAPAGVDPDDEVTGQSPAPGTSARRGDIVSASFEPRRIRVPNLVGLDVAEALERTDDRGLVLDTQVDEGTITGQAPEAGTRVAVGTTVSVTVELGVTVPNLLGLSVQEARKVVDRVGLELDLSDGSGTVVEQDPRAGSTAKAGDLVLVSLSAPVPPPWWQGPGGVAAVVGALLAAGAGLSAVRRWRARRWVRGHVRLVPRPSSTPLPGQHPAPGAAPHIRVRVRSGPRPHGE